jgi:hypothetical protein
VHVFLDYIEWFTNRSKQWKRFLEMLDGRTEMAVMFVEAPMGMGKTFLIKKMVHHCREADMAHVYIDFAWQEVASFLYLVRGVRDQLSPLVGGVHFNPLTELINHYTDPQLAGKASGPHQTVIVVTLPAAAGEGAREVRVDLVQLRKRFIATYQLQEMQGLADELGFYFDDIEGNTRSTYALGLINRCQRDGKLPQLLSALKAQRTFVDWWGEVTDSAGEADSPLSPGDAPTAGEETVDDLGFETLPADDLVRQEAITKINLALRNCLKEVSQRHKIIFLIDSYERRSATAEPWLHQNLLSPIIDQQLDNLIVLIAGRETPDMGDRRPVAGKTGLDPFTIDHVREYIEERRNLEEDINTLFKF